MIKINLLPHREIRRQERRKAFYSISVLTVLIACSLCFIVYYYFDSKIQEQQDRNDFLVKTNKDLDKEIEQIKMLEARAAALRARIETIEKLQQDRGNAVRLLKNLVKAVPDGVYLTEIAQKGAKVTLKGYAQYNQRLPVLVDQLNETGFFSKSEVVDSKAIEVEGRVLYGYSLTTYVTPPKVVKPKSKTKSAAE